MSICPAAGQVVENTPCPAVKCFVTLQWIASNPCLYGWTLHYFHSNVDFCELGTQYTCVITLKLSASFRTRNRKYSVSGNGTFSEYKPFHSKYSSYTILGDVALVSTAQGYDYHRNTSVLFLPLIALFSKSFRTRNRKYSVSGSRTFPEYKSFHSKCSS